MNNRLNRSSFARKRTSDDFVRGGVEIEDVHTRKAVQPEEETVRAQVYLTRTQKEWLRRMAYEQNTQMSKILREVLDEAMDRLG